MRAHERSSTYVRAHYRGSVFIPGHERNGSSVSGTYRVSAPAAHPNRWRLQAYRSSLAYWTTCFLGCRQRVFFYRSENGGCALFDRPGAPWKLHACWETYRDGLLDRVSAELDRFQFDGRSYVEPRTEIERLRGEHEFSGRGYVDGSLGSTITFPSYRGCGAIGLTAVRFVPDQNNERFITIYVPEASRNLFSPYSLHDIRATWVKHRNRWRCLVTATRIRQPNVPDGESHDVLPLERACTYCGDELATRWGLDVAGNEECSECGRRCRPRHSATESAESHGGRPDDLTLAHRRSRLARLALVADGPR